ncbi:proline-rich protein 18-like [Lutra lutra]|uniref:proline-rich protein 18-like n=1 Tax=Lutra lutra TaxID=9657 RepID=UPI001FD41523|nr:proline-rich protein 18-like [Lutra lutra]
MTDAAEAAFSPRTPPSHCSHRAPRPRPPDPPPPRASRVPAPPPHGALGARRAWGARRPRAGAGAGSGGWGPRRAAGLLARPPVPSPGPSARARQVPVSNTQLAVSSSGTSPTTQQWPDCSMKCVPAGVSRFTSSPPVAVCTIAPARARGCEDVPHLP